MVTMDKYNVSQNEFFQDLTSLAKRYFELDGIQAETFFDEKLQITLTITVKKAKDVKRVLA